MKKKLIYGCSMALLSLMFLNGCGKKETLEQEIVGTVQEVEESVQEAEIEDKDEVTAEGQTPIENTDYINWAKAPILSQTEWVDNRFADDGTLLVEGRFQTIEVSGEGYEKAAGAIREWTIKQEEAFVKNVDLNESYALDEVGNNPNFYGYSSTVEINPVRTDASIISLKGFYYDYSGGVHGNYSSIGTTFDVKTGQQLSFWDLTEDRDTFSRYTLDAALQQVTEDYADGLFEGYQEIIKEIWETEPNWYLDASGLTIVFSPYEIGPYAMGEAYVRLNYHELGTLLKEEYQMGAQAGVAVLPLGEEAEISLNHVSGEKEIVKLYWKENGEEYIGLNQYMLSVGEQTILAAEIDRLDSIYLIQKENGKTFLLFEGDMASDDYVTYLYELTDGQIQKTYKSDSCAFICEGTVTTEGMRLGIRVDALGTYTAYGYYEITEEGSLEPISEWYEIESSYQGLTNIKDLPVVIEGEQTVLPAGSQIRITATNRNGILKYQKIDSIEEGEIHYTAGEDNWPVYIDGINENEYFEMLPYAG